MVHSRAPRCIPEHRGAPQQPLGAWPSPLARVYVCVCPVSPHPMRCVLVSPTAAQLPQLFPDSPSDSPLSSSPPIAEESTSCPRRILSALSLSDLSLISREFPLLSATTRYWHSSGLSPASRSPPGPAWRQAHGHGPLPAWRQAHGHGSGRVDRHPHGVTHQSSCPPPPAINASLAFPASSLTPAHTLGWS